MTSFAGSRNLDERRRRRLAGEADEIDSKSTSTTRATADDLSGDSRAAAEEAALLPVGAAKVSHLPVGKLISRKLWKLWGAGLLALLAGTGLLWAGSAESAVTTRTGPGFVYLFDLVSGRSVKPLATLLLLAASQLAWLIWWVRSRSPQDFSGRYRVWRWCAALGGAATLAVATDFHLAWSSTVLWLWDGDVWNRERLVWLTPPALAALWALRRLHREMRDCRSSLSLLWLAAACGLGVAVLNLGVVQIPLPAVERQLLHWGAELSACWLLFMSLLLHARHVVHVTADPPRLRLPLFNWESLLRFAPRNRKRSSIESKQEKTGKPAAQKKAKPAPVAKKAKPAAKPQATPAVENETASVDEPATLSIKDRADDAESDDDHATDGLSKRERRRLRKQQQRRAA